MSDLHLGHAGITKFRQGFNSAEEHHEILFDNLASNVTKRDTIILLGDVAFTSEWNKRIASIRCLSKVLVMGNHDRDKLTITELAETYDKIYSLVSMRKVWLSHCPIHPEELRRRKGCFHGHTHYNNISDARYVNLSVEQTNFMPITWQEAEERLNDAVNPSVQEL